MEIEITSLLDLDAFPLSHSQAEGGRDAGRNSWQAAMGQAEDTALLDTPEKLDAFRDWVRPFGGWEDEEIDAWTPQECNALFLQWIAGDTRQAPALLDGVTFEERNGEWFFSTEEEPDMETGPFESREEAHQAASPGRGYATADSLDQIDWEAFKSLASAGRIHSYLFRADDGRVFFSLNP